MKRVKGVKGVKRVKRVLFVCMKCKKSVRGAGKRVDQIQKLCGYCAGLKKGIVPKEERPLAWDLSKTKEWLIWMEQRVKNMKELYKKEPDLSSIELMNLTKGG